MHFLCLKIKFEAFQMEPNVGSRWVFTYIRQLTRREQRNEIRGQFKEFGLSALLMDR
jgi:hypothetical protein